MIHCCSLKAPKAIGHCHRVWITWKNLIFSSRLAQKIPESDVAVDQQYPQVLPTRTWLISGNTARKAKHRQQPGTLLAEVLLPRVSRTCLEVGKSQPSGKCRASLRSLSCSLLSPWCNNCVLSSLLVFLLSHL